VFHCSVIYNFLTGTSTSTCIVSFIGAGVGAQDVDYHLSANGMIKFKDKIYVPDNSEVKKIILREFHVKSYLDHLSHQKTLRVVMNF